MILTMWTLAAKALEPNICLNIVLKIITVQTKIISSCWPKERIYYLSAVLCRYSRTKAPEPATHRWRVKFILALIVFLL